MAFLKLEPVYVESVIFLIKINKGDIRTANPTLSANAKRFNLYRHPQSITIKDFDAQFKSQGSQDTSNALANF